MTAVRPQWPHTVDDIIKALDGVWGVVGAISVKGNMIRLERSMKAPLSYKFIEYKGPDDSSPLRTVDYSAEQKSEAVSEFATLLGFKNE